MLSSHSRIAPRGARGSSPSLGLGGTFCEKGEPYFDTCAMYHLRVGD
ncbi:hypothetical protein [Nannocystis exedens]|nr:hypothetical protein [Nannocystis exedens]